MKIRKAVITAANPAQRSLPLQTFVDRDGTQRSALAILIAEVVSAGVDEVAVVIHPGDEPAYSEAAGPERDRIQFVPQPAALGYGHAISLAAGFSEGEPVLHLICDHLYITDETRSCAKQLVDTAELESCAVSAVQPLRESKITRYGIVGADPVPDNRALRNPTSPRKTDADGSRTRASRPRAQSRSLSGIHGHARPDAGRVRDLGTDDPRRAVLRTNRALTSAQRARLERKIPRARGQRDSLRRGARYGMLIAQLALALDGDDREEVLTQLVELLAVRSSIRRNENE